jgi:hypothetical protein
VSNPLTGEGGEQAILYLLLSLAIIIFSLLNIQSYLELTSSFPKESSDRLYGHVQVTTSVPKSMRWLTVYPEWK